MNTSEEAKFMAEQALKTLLFLYAKLKLTEPLRLRNNEEDIIITEDAAEIAKAWETLRNLTLAVKTALRRLQALITEELIFVNVGPSSGKIVSNLAAEHLPNALPVRVSKLTVETPANLLLAATIAEVKNRLRRVEQKLLHYQRTSDSPLVNFAVKRLRELASHCENLLSEPALRPLVQKAEFIARNERALRKLEASVKLDAARRPREYTSYRLLLRLRENLKAEVHAIERFVREHGETLTLRLTLSKLYELYGFTLILEALFNQIKVESWQVRVIEGSRVLELKRGNEKILISYNALPDDVKSRLASAKAYGLLKNSIDISLIGKLGGLPDTIILLDLSQDRKLIIIDYKYTRSLSYIVSSRFKALSYLFEFDAYCAVIVVPSLEETSEEPREKLRELVREELDEEAWEHLSFYRSINERGGAIIRILNNFDSNSKEKYLAIVHVDPTPESIENAKYAIKNLLQYILGEYKDNLIN